MDENIFLIYCTSVVLKCFFFANVYKSAIFPPINRLLYLVLYRHLKKRFKGCMDCEYSQTFQKNSWSSSEVDLYHFSIVGIIYDNCSVKNVLQSCKYASEIQKAGIRTKMTWWKCYLNITWFLSHCLAHLKVDNKDVLNTAYLIRGAFRQDCIGF